MGVPEMILHVVMAIISIGLLCGGLLHFEQEPNDEELKGVPDLLAKLSGLENRTGLKHDGENAAKTPSETGGNPPEQLNVKV